MERVRVVDEEEEVVENSGDTFFIASASVPFSRGVSGLNSLATVSVKFTSPKEPPAASAVGAVILPTL